MGEFQDDKDEEQHGKIDLRDKMDELHDGVNGMYTVVDGFHDEADGPHDGADGLHGMQPLRWQRGYYDHIIRNDEEYWAIRKYIETNPQNFQMDKQDL